MKKLTIALCTIAIAAIPTTSHAAAQVVIAPPGAQIAGTFDSPVTVAVKSEPLTFVNLDPLSSAHHNIKSVAYGPDSAPWCSGFALGHCPLFVSDLVGVGGTSTADLRNTVAGQTYAFICELHANMKGTLVVAA